MLIIGWTDMSDRFITRYFLRFKASRKFQAKRSYFMINVRKLALSLIRVQFLFSNQIVLLQSSIRHQQFEESIKEF